MSKKIVLLTSFLTICLNQSLSIRAHAQESQVNSDVDLVERLSLLEQELSTLKGKLNSLDAADDNAVKWKGAPEVKSPDGWSVKPRGRVMYDVANLSSVPSSMDIPGEGFSDEARRVRLGIQGTMPGGFGYKLEMDFSGGVSITDAYLDYKNEGLEIIIGQHNTFQGFEELSSSNDTSFIERAAFTDAFGFERRLGVSASYAIGNINVQGGLFTHNVEDEDDGTNSLSVDVRAFVSPKIEGKQFHFGGSVHRRDLGDTIDSLRYRARPMVHSVNTRFINTSDISDAETENGFGLEFAMVADRFHTMAEMYSLEVERTGFEDPSFFGGAIEAGYFLTNDTRPYKGGIFKGVKVNSPLSAGGTGAWQINVRFDRLDLVDADIVGGTQNAYMASLIWTPVDNVRFLLNYGHIQYSEALDIVAGAPRDFSVNVIGARTQVTF